MSLAIVDLFCGAGGTSTGILKAGVRLGRRVELTAVNHWPTAVNTHSLNHPGVRHVCESVENLHPMELAPKGLDLLAASCECRFHSVARGGGPCNEQSRSQPWQLVRWASDVRVRSILMENVREFRDWGPLHARTKRPLKSGKGKFFRSFCQALEALGYRVEWRVQVAANYGDPTSRARLMLMARLDGKMEWPEPTHGPGRELGWRTARECIDWELKGTSIFNRKRPLCSNTLRRIAAGLKKFGGANAEPFLILLRGTSVSQVNGSAHSLDNPLPTATAGGGHLALCEPFVIGQQSGAVPRKTGEPMPTVATAGAIRLVEPFIVPPEGYYGGNTAKSVERPLTTITTVGGRKHMLVEPFLAQTDQTGGNGDYVRSTGEPMPTVVTKQNVLLVEPLIVKYYGSGICKSVSEPLDAVTTRDRFMLVEAGSGREVAELDIRTRMLQPHELAAAHSFPKGYQFTGNKSEQTKQIGNSVPVELSAAHAEAILR